MGTLLFILSAILTVIFYPLGFMYTVIRLSIGVSFKTLTKRVDQLMKQTAIAVDQLGNVFMQEVFNDFLIKIDMYEDREGKLFVVHPHKFGSEDETISSVLGKNKKLGTLTWFGKLLAWFLDKTDPNHVEKSIEEDEKRNFTDK